MLTVKWRAMKAPEAFSRVIRTYPCVDSYWVFLSWELLTDEFILVL